jgi:hypothetical protein
MTWDQEINSDLLNYVSVAGKEGKGNGGEGKGEGEGEGEGGDG